MTDVKNPKKTRMRAWVAVPLVLLGVSVAGVGGFVAVQEYVESTQAQTAPMPEDEELFDAEATHTYGGPSADEIDWEEEFSKIEFSDSADGEDDAHVEGKSAVVVPSLGMRSELDATGAENGSLALPEAPKGTWYEETSPVGADAGNTVLAGHVNHRSASTFSPWAHLHEAERGTLIGVRDDEGVIHVYEATSMDVYTRQGIPEEFFRTDGDPQLHLVTCSGEAISDDPDDVVGTYFENNLVVSADPVETIEG